MVDSPENLRRQARAIAARGNDANVSWSELRSWASGKGPVAMKSAMIEFISAHGSSPEAALLMPRLMSDQSLSAIERKELLSFSKQTVQPRPGFEALKPRLSAPSGKPSALRPAEMPRHFQLPSPADHADVRELHLLIREKTKMSLLPKPLETPRFDSTRSPDSVVMSAGMHKGEHLVHSLVEKLRSHARDEHPAHLAGTKAVERKTPKAKKKAVRKKAPPSKKAKRKPAKKARRK